MEAGVSALDKLDRHLAGGPCPCCGAIWTREFDPQARKFTTAAECHHATWCDLYVEDMPGEGE